MEGARAYQELKIPRPTRAIVTIWLSDPSAPSFVMAMQENRPMVCQILRSLRETGRVNFYTECVIKKIYRMGLVCEESGALLHCW